VASSIQRLEITKGGTERLTRHFSPGESVVLVEIVDTGGGIPEANLSKIFDPFFTTKEPGGGTGLGLTVTKQIIELHGGHIDIRNNKGRGVKASLLFKTAVRP
jgi:two-component system, NtrC family, sensor kinase